MRSILIPKIVAHEVKFEEWGYKTIFLTAVVSLPHNLRLKGRERLRTRGFLNG